MAPEATKMAVRCNMHMDIRVIEDLDFKSQVKFHIQGYQGHMEFTIASEVTTKAARDIMHMDLHLYLQWGVQQAQQGLERQVASRRAVRVVGDRRQRHLDNRILMLWNFH